MRYSLCICALVAGLACRCIADDEPREIVPYEPGDAFSEGLDWLLDNSWLDYLHDRVYHGLEAGVNGLDHMFAGQLTPVAHETNSSFRLRSYIQAKSEETHVDMRFRVRLSADLYLPELERRLYLFVNNRDPELLPGSDPMAEEYGLFVGLKRAFDVFDYSAFDTSAGVKWEWPPTTFVKVGLGRCFEHGDLMLTPKQTLFWYSDDRGFGGQSSIYASYELNPYMRIKSVSTAKLTESTEGVEWDQIFGFEECFSGSLDEPIMSLGSYVIATGRFDDSSTMQNYRWDIIVCRFPVRKRWLFMEVIPRIEWTNEDDWHSVPSILIGLDAVLRATSQSR